MAGRVAYFLIAGGAILGGMVVQGDSPIHFDGRDSDARVDVQVDDVVDRVIDRQVDRMVTVRSKAGEDLDATPETKRALAAAVAELVRAEGSLAMTDLEDEGAAALAAARQRRDAARQAVDRLADQAERESRGTRDEVRREIRDEVREAVRS